MSPEELRKAKLREQVLEQQKQMMSPGYVEPGIQEESELSIANLPKKAAVSKLKAEGMPIAAEIADIGIPELDVTNVVGKARQAGSAVSRMAGKEDEAKQVWSKILQLFRGQSTETLEKAAKLPLEEQKRLVAAAGERFKQLEKQKVGGKMIPAKNPLPGKGQGEMDLGDYFNQPSYESTIPNWKRKLEKP